MISFQVNGKEVLVSPDPPRSLLTILREELALTGTKDGCSKGHCGACTVLLNGEAKRACLIPVKNLQGKQVETIEGLERDGSLHPIQEAFVREMAIQCGFCTPGMIMAAKGLLDRNQNPSQEEIKEALRHNLCRCTGYTPIIRAIEHLKDSYSLTSYQRGLFERVKGEGIFTGDQRREGMLYGSLLLSSSPSALVKRIDLHKALQVPGVLALLTHQDIPGRKTFGLLAPHQPVLAKDIVRYRGEPLVLVIAVSQDLARKARDLIFIEYEELDPLFHPCLSLEEGARPIHEGGNILKELKIQKGDIGVGFQEADLLVENTYRTPMVEHGYLEPESALSYLDEEGRVVVETGSQSAFAIQEMVALSLGLPLERVRVITFPPGGAFGGKEEPTVQIHAALGALLLKAPVKITLSREESIRISTKRHRQIIHYKSGVKRDGRLTAIQVHILADTGAYASLGEAVLNRSVSFCSGPYQIPHVDVKGVLVYTNHPPSGAMRGFGSPQVAFAAESQMNQISYSLGIDPLELRELNALKEGSETITGQVLGKGIGLEEIISILKAERAKIKVHPHKKEGLGVALAFKNVGLGGGVKEEASAILELVEGGDIRLLVGAVDMGQGLTHTMATIASQALNISWERIKVVCSDTHVTPDGGITTASRQTYLTGNAVLKAALLFQEEMRQEVARCFSIHPEDLRIGEEIFYKEERLLSQKELFLLLAKEGRRIHVQASYQAPSTTPIDQGRSPFLHYAYCFAGQLVLLSCHQEKAQVQVKKVVAVNDLGRAIYKQGALGQIMGGVMMGLGYALQEEYLEGSTTLKEQGILSIKEAPLIKAILVEKEDPCGPFGAKGMAELPVSPTAPAVTDAIYQATGILIKDLPVRKVLEDRLRKEKKEVF